MTKGPNSPDVKRPPGGRSPVPEDADMTDKPQLKIPEVRGALGRGSGGSGDRHSAPRAAPARRITALGPEELTQGFLLHEEQFGTTTTPGFHCLQVPGGCTHGPQPHEGRARVAG